MAQSPTDKTYSVVVSESGFAQKADELLREFHDRLITGFSAKSRRYFRYRSKAWSGRAGDLLWRRQLLPYFSRARSYVIGRRSGSAFRIFSEIEQAVSHYLPHRFITFRKIGLQFTLITVQIDSHYLRA
ncbi:hypothetical protein [Pseudaminobacter soli (ex Li et al. 2025)]|uniref:hypothetical protein n=1 Tax=Pseudaminobacter soli (ex Li et al. 2025) TaxID=1295366 RepID=UPI0011B26013|nr:hypothetical protein [Mesorhizobium soli]